MEVGFKAEEQPDNSRESCSSGSMGREVEGALAGSGAGGRRLGTAWRKELQWKMGQEKPESSMRGDGMKTTAELETSALETSEQRVMARSWEHIEVGTAIEIRKVRDTVIRTKLFDLS